MLSFICCFLSVLPRLLLLVSFRSFLTEFLPCTVSVFLFTSFTPCVLCPFLLLFSVPWPFFFTLVSYRYFLIFPLVCPSSPFAPWVLSRLFQLIPSYCTSFFLFYLLCSFFFPCTLSSALASLYPFSASFLTNVLSFLCLLFLPSSHSSFLSFYSSFSIS